MQIAIVLGLLVLAVILFATEKISVDVVTLLLLITLVGTGILTTEEAFAGFSSEIVVILAAIFVVSGALQETGVLDLIGAAILRLAAAGHNRLLLIMMAAASGTSAFMNNTTVTAMLVPPVIGLARKARLSPSKLLMPLAYASILGGTCTLIGTSTNVAVSGYIDHAKMTPLGMFELAPIGLVIVAVGVLYIMFIGQRLLPDRAGGDPDVDFGLRAYLSEIVVLPGSPLIGQSSFESDLNVLDFRIFKIYRGEEEILPARQVEIAERDVLLVEGNVGNLMKVKKIEGIEMDTERKMGDLTSARRRFRIAEVLVTAQSEVVGRTLREANFRQRYGLTVLAVARHGETLRDMVGNVVIRAGDLLLVQGPPDRLESLRADRPGLAVLDEVTQPLYSPRRGMFTISIFLIAIVIGTLGWLPLSVAFLSAAVVAVLTRCISLEKAYEFIDWRLLILIGGMTAFGVAMEKTGTAEFLANHIVEWMEPMGVMAILAAFLILTILLTQPMSNAAAALVVLPVALTAAQKLGVNERTFAIGIMLAASVSFIAPFEPSCILVYGPGKYRFMDFVRTGSGLTAVLTIVVLLLVPVFWPLR
jgi:di/tricarboxylate transporter